MQEIPNADFGHPGQIDCHILGICSGCEFPDGNALELTLAIPLGLIAAGTSAGGTVRSSQRHVVSKTESVIWDSAVHVPMFLYVGVFCIPHVFSYFSLCGYSYY